MTTFYFYCSKCGKELESIVPIPLTMPVICGSCNKEQPDQYFSLFTEETKNLKQLINDDCALYLSQVPNRSLLTYSWSCDDLCDAIWITNAAYINYDENEKYVEFRIFLGTNISKRLKNEIPKN